MEISYERLLTDENLRDELERRAHQERAAVMARFLALAAAALRQRLPRIAQPRIDACA